MGMEIQMPNEIWAAVIGAGVGVLSAFLAWVAVARRSKRRG